MSLIKGKNTGLERLVFVYLRKNGVYFQKHYCFACGKPDIALPRKKRAVFIDSDFWHGKRYTTDQMKRLPPFWRNKIRHNVIRDKEVNKTLRSRGWKVLRIRESDLLKRKDSELKRTCDFLKA